MKNTFGRAILSLVIFLVVGCGLVFVWEEQLKCELNFLVFDETKMPIGWQNVWGIIPPTLEPLGAEDAYRMVMEKGKEGGSHTVYQYPNNWLAIFHMWFEKESFFPSTIQTWSEWEYRDNIPLQADQIQIKCMISNESYLNNNCIAVLRYDFYISDFGYSFEGDEVNNEEFQEIILKIDEQFSSCQK